MSRFAKIAVSLVTLQAAAGKLIFCKIIVHGWSRNGSNRAVRVGYG